MKKKKILIIGTAIIIMIFVIVGFIFFTNGTKDKMVIRVDGWDMEYTNSDRNLTVENFESIEVGSSLEEIENKLGKPDGWIGSGILSPVYVLEDNSAVELVFKNDVTNEDLGAIYLYKGEDEFKLNIIDEEAQYIEFKELFKEHKDDMQAFIELTQESILGEKEYLILFDEDWYSSMQSGNQSGEWITILYNNSFVSEGNEEIAEALNTNNDLIKTLDSMKEKGVIIEIGLTYLDGSIQMVEFTIDPEFTPFITGNNGVVNWFGYCNDEDCERYGYKNIEDNWYMYISPQPE